MTNNVCLPAGWCIFSFTINLWNESNCELTKTVKTAQKFTGYNLRFLSFNQLADIIPTDLVYRPDDI